MQAAAAQKRAFVGIMGALSSLAAYGCFWQLRRYQESSNRWNKVLDELDTFTPHELKGYDAKYYPWVRESSRNEWEHKLVKLTGYFKEERFFVRKARDGRAGYSVFAPFVTAMDDYDLLKDTNANPMLEYGIMVNLGWVPAENKNDIEMGSEPIPLLVSLATIFFNSNNRMLLRMMTWSLKTPTHVYLLNPKCLMLF